MRDIALFAFVFGMLPFILKHSYIGVLAWSWVSYMNPHRLTWGAAYGFPFAQVVGLALLISLMFNKDPKKLPFNSMMGLWIAFMLWTLLTSATAIFPNDALTYEVQVFKIQLVIFISLWIMGTEQRIKLMIWVMFFSVGFFGIKGGVFTIMTGGAGRVWGPGGSFIKDNNHLATALLMVIPLGLYLRKHEVKKKLHKNLMLLCVLLITASVLGSFSRGAFLAIGVVSLYLWWKSSSKLITGVFGALALILLIFSMPASWMDRMASIQNYEEDASAAGRLNSWVYAINLANDRVTGGGYLSWSDETFARWAPNPDRVLVAHSIYFSVLADHGWIGLIMFVSLFYMGWYKAGKVAKAVRVRGSPEDEWIADLMNMIKVSLLAYGSGGAFLSLAYFDLPWHLLAVIILVEQQAIAKGLMDKQQNALQRFSRRAAT